MLNERVRNVQLIIYSNNIYYMHIIKKYVSRTVDMENRNNFLYYRYFSKIHSIVYEIKSNA